MLILKEMNWSNCFSYADNNTIQFNKNPLTQLVGYNGAGKTSISLMLQEILYGKNNKNIKKQDIANNKSGVKGYSINLKFSKDSQDYEIDLDRKSSLKLKLYKNGEDISSHTSLNTYKSIAEIVGITDFKVFCQLIYQHSTDSLDFLTATDTNRKKFLISLLQLDKYIQYHELFKDKVRNIQLDINKESGAVSAIETWIKTHEDMDFIKQNLIEIEPINSEWYLRKSSYQEKINNINSINRKIATNNQYKKELTNLDSKYYLGSAPSSPNPNSTELRTQLRILESKSEQHQLKINKLTNVSGTCPQCLQEVNEHIAEKMIREERDKKHKLSLEINKLKDTITSTQQLEQEISRYNKEKIEFERLNQLIDPKLETKTLDLAELKSKLENVSNLIKEAERIKKSNEDKNLKISAHNSKVDVVKSQLDKMRKIES